MERQRWENKTKIDLTEIGLKGVQIHLVQNGDWWQALKDTMMNFRDLVPRS
jgi:hypothetical protein